MGSLTLLEVVVAAVALFDTDEAAQKALGALDVYIYLKKLS